MKKNPEHIPFTRATERELSKFRKYLETRQLVPQTIIKNLNYTTIYLNWLEKENISASKANYNDVLVFTNYCRESGKSINQTNRVLVAIRYYYNFISINLPAGRHGNKKIKINNPASGLHIKGRIRTVPQNLLAAAELDEIYQSYQSKTLTEKRNKIILGLVIYQCLARKELSSLEPGHINLKQGKIYVPGVKGSNSRILKLEGHQIIDLHKYLQEIRPKILSETRYKTDRLFSTIDKKYSGKDDYSTMKNILSYLIKTLRKSYPKLESVTQLRQSVVSQWVKKYNLREVQYMAGYKAVSTAERYKENDMEDLQLQLNKYHPLG